MVNATEPDAELFISVKREAELMNRIADLEHGNKLLRDELNKDESVMASDQARIAELEKALLEIRELTFTRRPGSLDKAKEIANRVTFSLVSGCHRSHPHEDMNAECKRLAEIASANNQRAHGISATRSACICPMVGIDQRCPVHMLTYTKR